MSCLTIKNNTMSTTFAVILKEGESRDIARRVGGGGFGAKM